MNRYFLKDLSIGMEESFEDQISNEMLDSFVLLSGDDNPLHTNEAFARQFGFDNRVVHGLLAAALYSKLVGKHLPGQYSLLHGIKIDFRKPIYVGVKLRVKGSVSFIQHSYQQIQLDANICDLNGKLFNQAKIRVGLIE